jgi:hypothetical protein
MAQLLFGDVESQIGVIRVIKKNLTLWAFVPDMSQQSGPSGCYSIGVLNSYGVAKLIHLIISWARKLGYGWVSFVDNVSGVANLQIELLNRAIVPDLSARGHHGKLTIGGAIRDAEMLRRPLKDRLSEQAELIRSGITPTNHSKNSRDSANRLSDSVNVEAHLSAFLSRRSSILRNISLQMFLIS